MASTLSYGISTPAYVPLRELDRRYFSYATSLPPPLGDLLKDRRLLGRATCAGSIRSLAEIHPLVVCLPWVFYDRFPVVPRSRVLEITEAGALLLLALFLRDHYLDGQLPATAEIVLLHDMLHDDAMRRFYAMFDARSPFWRRFERYAYETTTALLREAHARAEKVVDTSIASTSMIGSGKVALMKAIPTALAISAGADAQIDKLEEALTSYSAALQLSDDIADWEVDYARHHYTAPLALAVPVAERGASPTPIDVVRQRFNQSVILETLLKRVSTWLQQAVDAIPDVAGTRWEQFLGEHKIVVLRHRELLAPARFNRFFRRHAIRWLRANRNRGAPSVSLQHVFYDMQDSR